MSDYDVNIREINQAQSLEQIERIIWRFSAQAPSGSVGGILYSGSIAPGLKAEEAAIALSEKTGASIINNTPRGQFLGTKAVEDAITESASRIFESKGLSQDFAKKAASYFLYGKAGLSPGNYLSIQNCLWCKSSREFVASLSGDVLVVAKGASPDRVLGQVELPAALTNSKINAIGGVPREVMQSLQKTAGTPYVLLISQNAFIEAEKGITQDVHGKVQLSPRALSALGADKLVQEAAKSAALVHPPVPPAGIVSARTLGAVARFAGVVATGYDAVTTAYNAKQLSEQGNNPGVQSEITLFASRNLSMWGGAAVGAKLGAELGAAAGIESGPLAPVPGIAGGIAGGLVGAVAGNWLAGKIDQHKIYNQQGSDGNTWHFDPKHPDQGWTREVAYDGPANRLPLFNTRPLQADLGLNPLDSSRKLLPQRLNIVPDGVPLFDTHPIRADAGLSNELNFKASSTAAELALAHASPAQDPDNSPHAIATRYQTSYEQYGWQQYGPMPEAVSAALAPVRQSTTPAAMAPLPAYSASEAAQPRRQHDGPPEAVSKALTPMRHLPPPAVAPLPASEPEPQRHKPQEHSPHSGVQSQHPATAGLTPQSSPTEMLMALSAAAARNDDEGMRAVGLAYEASDAGRELRQRVEHLRLLHEQEQKALGVAGLTYRDPGHPDHGLYRTLREQMPSYLCDEKIGEVTLVCRQHRFKTGDDIKAVYINGHDATIVGHHPALYAQIDLRPPAPWFDETMAQARAYDAQVQQQALERQQMQEMQQGRGMSR